ncbi:HtrA2 peptidase [Thioalkalivibrio sp. K90mix]|jgi:serine protease DegS|uniref:trypsin-like peptidase domain-containing protein n=1 Tax=Thioalkalivibrio sp. (strain K90mix) TaxID=396595 RepID=UPI0001959F96|nr:trypsin-like peptidase domain-containing protein [Thioalkalivibrio sp. K90mix]ADC72711.1 HtrA2 peptidase [Thioalkalivibrio sp. K90mix]
MVNFSRFLLQAALTGVAIAVVVAVFFPHVLDRDRAERAELQVATPLSTTNGAAVSYADGVERAAPAVVNIMTSRVLDTPGILDLHEFFGQPMPPGDTEQASLGSGVIMTDRGHILTNHHVIEEADAIAVVLPNGDAHPVEIIGIDPDTDLAVLRIRTDEVAVATVGHSRDLRVGDVVLAIGNPFGVGQTVTQGIVSATGRNQLGINTFEDFIQTDAAINPGNSGGALINAKGEVIGINTAIFSRSGGSHGIGFAIPVDLARDVMTEIIEQGYVARGWLGIEVQAMNRELADSFGLDAPRGVLVAGILRDGPAQEAGIEIGDAITHLNGDAVNSPREALNVIARTDPGADLSIKLLRDGEEVELEASVAQRPI